MVNSSPLECTAVDVSKCGTNLINARLSTGAAVGFTSLAVKMQASPDGSGDWVDITGATFTTVTAGTTLPEIISFQLPTSLTLLTSPYKYVRAHCTLVGTSILAAISLLCNIKFDGGVGSLNTPPTIN